MNRLTRAQLEELASFDTPTVANAVEQFDVRSRTEGFMKPEIRCIVLGDKPITGYAFTCKMSAVTPPSREQESLRMKYYEELKDTPSPSIAVIQDVNPYPVGGYLGSISASMHKVFGCVGFVTNGSIRDLGFVENLGVACFGTCVLVYHGYIHVVETACPVEVGGLIIKPGDLLHADRHGVLLVPGEIAGELAAVCRRIEEAEEPLLDRCRERFGMGMAIEELVRLRADMLKRRDPLFYGASANDWRT